MSQTDGPGAPSVGVALCQAVHVQKQPLETIGWLQALTAGKKMSKYVGAGLLWRQWVNKQALSSPSMENLGIR